MNIDIRVLQVNEKTLTTWMYKQLPYKPLIDYYEAKLNGNPLGYVDCITSGIRRCALVLDNDHRHVIWEKEGELFTCTVEQRVLPPDFAGWDGKVSKVEQLEKYTRWMKSQKAAWNRVAALKQIFLEDCPKSVTPEKQEDEKPVMVDWA